MFEQILKHRPKGATHWDVGTYYKKDGDKWFYWDRLWFRVADISTLNMWMNTLPEDKEPAMSEFKVGDKVVFQNSKSDDTEIYTVEAVLDGGRFLGINDYRQAFSSIKFRHAEPQEKAAGHRIESSNDQAISDCSVSNLCQNDTQNSLPIKQENQDMGDDSHIENHISPLCKSKDV